MHILIIGAKEEVFNDLSIVIFNAIPDTDCVTQVTQAEHIRAPVERLQPVDIILVVIDPSSISHTETHTISKMLVSTRIFHHMIKTHHVFPVYICGTYEQLVNYIGLVASEVQKNL